jgi:hypothetical protein
LGAKHISFKATFLYFTVILWPGIKNLNAKGNRLKPEFLTALTILFVITAWAGTFLYKNQSPISYLNLISMSNLPCKSSQSAAYVNNSDILDWTKAQVNTNESLNSQKQTETIPSTDTKNNGINSETEEVETTSLKYTYPLEIINLRSAPSVNSEIHMQLQAFSYLEILNRSNKETINNFTDYWYKVKTYKEDGAVQTGFVFGIFYRQKWKVEKRLFLGLQIWM